MYAFNDLGKRLEDTWGKEANSEDAFPEMSRSLLIESQLLQRVKVPEIVSWLLESPEVPEQDLYEFGETPIIVYRSKSFYIQVLFWLDGSTSIHEHGFSGAFGVLSGSSVHSRYTFEPESPETGCIRFGKTRFLDSELLGQGDVRSIEKGHRFAHCLYHLERPSVSVVVRTWKAENDQRQYDYYSPYLAVDPFHVPKRETIQLRMLTSLLATNRPQFWQQASQMVSRCDAWMLWKILSIAFPWKEDLEWRSFCASGNEAHPLLFDRMLRCAEEALRGLKIFHLRNTVHDPVHRFFLGLLLNVPNRSVLYDLVSRRFPSADPEALVLRWLAEIFCDTSKGLKLTPLSNIILQFALQHPDFDHAQPALRARFPGISRSQDVQQIRKLWDAVRSKDLLAPLFTVENKNSGISAEILRDTFVKLSD